jgi:hypothetical protein
LRPGDTAISSNGRRRPATAGTGLAEVLAAIHMGEAAP